MRRLILFVTILINLNIAFSQEIRFLPIQIFQFPQTYAFINPASNTSDYKYELIAGHRGNLGEFNNTFVDYFNAQIKFYQGQTRYHNLGLNVIGYHDGQFLRKNLVQINYAWHTQLSDKTSIAAGASLGAMNYAAISTPLTNGGSSIAPDGNVGIWIYGSDFYLGYSVNQIFNSALSPLNEITRMVRHNNLVVGKNFALNKDIEIRSAILLRYVPNSPLNANVSLSAVLRRLLLVGINYQRFNGLTITGGLENIKLKENRFRFLFTFQLYTPRNYLALQSYELGLGYFLKKSYKNKNIEDKIEENDDE